MSRPETIPIDEPACDAFVMPASFAQHRLWFLDRLTPGSSLYNVPVAFRLDGELDVDLLERSVNVLIERHEALRTTFDLVDGEPVQVVAERATIAIDRVELPAAGDRDRAARTRIAELATRPFDLGAGPLVRVHVLGGAGHWYVVFVVHHIVFDGWSYGILVRELDAVYTALSQGRQPELDPLPIQFADFAIWQRSWLDTDEFASQLGYWRSALANLTRLELPTDRPRPARATFGGATFVTTIDGDVVDRLEALSRREGATLYMTLLAAFGVLLGRYSGAEDVVVGSPIANRDRVEIEGLIGFFVNTLVMRTDLTGEPTFRELVGRVRGVAISAYANQGTPFERIIEALNPERSLGQNPIFQVNFALQNAPGGPMRLGGASGEYVVVETGTAKFDLAVDAWRTPAGLACRFEYSTDLYDEATVVRMSEHYATLLRAAAENPDRSIARMPMLGDAEWRALVDDFNATDAPFPTGSCAHELFEAQAARTPGAIAVRYGDDLVSYRELNWRANRIAHFLRARGVTSGALVGLFLERSVDLVAAILGVWKAGGAYLPIDASYPFQRIAFVLDDAKPVVVLTHEALLGDLPATGAQIVCLDTDLPVIALEPTDRPASLATPRSLAYVIYTSGSTGAPKGAMIEHRGLVNYLTWAAARYRPYEGSSVPVHSPVGFDLTVTSLLVPLAVGQTVVLAREGTGTAPLEAIARRGRDYGLVKLTPAHLEVLSRQLPVADVAGWARTLVVGGEALKWEHLALWRDHAPATRIVNEYGPTETVVGCCVYESLAGDGGSGPVPIGRPIANTRLYVLDAHLQPVPVGVPGELFIGGVGVARGYLNRPELTAERFLDDPFVARPDARMYRTGDLVRHRADGNLEYLGRADRQVKIRGYRIELGEVESVLEGHDAVREAIVRAYDGEGGDRRLVAYVTHDHGARLAGGEQAKVDLEREHVSQWRMVFDESFRQAAAADPAASTGTWISSYTGEPISADETREWADAASNRIAALAGRRVLEIGCGAGTLLLRLAPACERYVGTDISSSATSWLDDQVRRQGLHGVEVLTRGADDFEGFGDGEFDCVAINSVVQYFPGVDYLARVLAKAVRSVRDGGAVYVGDVRSLAHVEAFRSGVELTRADARMPVDELAERVRREVRDEQELLVAPTFFDAFAATESRISSVEISLERGVFDNEMTRYRYDVVLRVGAAAAAVPAPAGTDWDAAALSVERLGELLAAGSDDAVHVVNVPNARLVADVTAAAILAEPGALATAADLRRAVEAASARVAAVWPEQLWKLGARHGYRVDLTWSASGALDRFDALFVREGATARRMARRPATPRAEASHFANDPLRAVAARTLPAELRAFLVDVLPEYMVPSAFVVLEAFPLTENGKVDVARLPEPEHERPDLLGVVVEPRDDVERGLVEIWERLLGVAPVGVRDGFFELGGHSLLAVKLFSEIERAFGKNLPLATLFTAPTVEQLAELLRETHVPGDEWSSLVPIQREGARRPFFCIHAGGGNVLFYRDLSRRLGSDQPFYALQPQGLDGKRPRHETIEEMAAHYIEEMRSVQPTGPYYVAGSSFGGNVAFEIAQQLHAAGAQVGLVALFDTFGPGYPRYAPGSTRLRRRMYEVAHRFDHHFGSLTLLDPRERLAYVREKAAKALWLARRAISRQRSELLRKLYRAVRKPLPTSLRKVQSNIDQALVRYQPKPYPGRVTLFRASKQPGGIITDPHLGWGPFALGGLDVFEVPGNHGNIVVEPRVRFLVDRLRACLDAEPPSDRRPT